VGGEPFFVASASGARLRTADGEEHLDYVCSWGPLILGHAHPEVVEAVARAAARGTTYGAPTEDEVELAELVCRLVPSAERVRFVSSGTEAAMTAVRLSRGITGRDLIVKLVGGYHGHADSFLVAAGSGVATLGIPGSPGVPEAVAELTACCPYNDLDSIEELLARRGARVAAIVVEPVAGNMGVVPPAPGFLEGLRALATRHGSLLVFDEVITGFRVAAGGAQELYGVVPDLTVLGKVLGGGLPVGAVAGPALIMDQLAPEGRIYQAGTLSGNPLAMAAGRATLEALLRREDAFVRLEALGAALERGILEAARRTGTRVTVNRVGSMLTPFLCEGPVRCFEDAKKADPARYGRLFHGLLRRGIFIAPSAFEAMFLSLAHTERDIDATASAFADALAEAL
jgi:glutamate-1-semialdehyde 2,1-aminomutase